MESNHHFLCCCCLERGTGIEPATSYLEGKRSADRAYPAMKLMRLCAANAFIHFHDFSPVIKPGGNGEIRTHGALRLAGFQDQSLQPLGHVSLVDQDGFEPSRLLEADLQSAGIVHSPTNPVILPRAFPPLRIRIVQHVPAELAPNFFGCWRRATLLLTISEPLADLLFAGFRCVRHDALQVELQNEVGYSEGGRPAIRRESPAVRYLHQQDRTIAIRESMLVLSVSTRCQRVATFSLGRPRSHF